MRTRSLCDARCAVEMKRNLKPDRSKLYSCTGCGRECHAPTYLRLQLTRCGLVQAKQCANRNRSIPIGHFCRECLTARVRTVVGRDLKESEDAGLASGEGAPTSCAHAKDLQERKGCD